MFPISPLLPLVCLRAPLPLSPLSHEQCDNKQPSAYDLACILGFSDMAVVGGGGEGWAPGAWDCGILSHSASFDLRDLGFEI